MSKLSQNMQQMLLPWSLLTFCHTQSDAHQLVDIDDIKQVITVKLHALIRAPHLYHGPAFGRQEVQVHEYSLAYRCVGTWYWSTLMTHASTKALFASGKFPLPLKAYETNSSVSKPSTFPK